MVNKVNCSVVSVGYKINKSAVNTTKAAEVLVAGKNVPSSAISIWKDINSGL